MKQPQLSAGLAGTKAPGLGVRVNLESALTPLPVSQVFLQRRRSRFAVGWLTDWKVRGALGRHVFRIKPSTAVITPSVNHPITGGMFFSKSWPHDDVRVRCLSVRSAVLGAAADERVPNNHRPGGTSQTEGPPCDLGYMSAARKGLGMVPAA